jgi:hypothetical protein
MRAETLSRPVFSRFFILFRNVGAVHFSRVANVPMGIRPSSANRLMIFLSKASSLEFSTIYLPSMELFFHAKGPDGILINAIQAFILYRLAAG